MLRNSNSFAIAGLAAIATGMTSSIFLVTDVLLPRWAAATLTLVSEAHSQHSAFAFPLSRRYDRWDDDSA